MALRIKTHRPRLLGLYRDWREAYRPIYAKWVNLLSILIYSFVIPTDFFLYGANATLFTPFRSAAIGLSLVNLMLLRGLPRYRASWRLPVALFCFLSPTFFVTIEYIYFTVIAGDMIYADMLLAIFMTVAISCFGIYRFWLEHYTFHLFGLVVWGIAARLNPMLEHTFFLVAVMHLSTFGVFFYYRREFVGQMYERFTNLSTFVPGKVAHHIMASPGNRLADAFRPSNRFTVCLCSDWRNYHDLLSTRSSSEISRLMEVFYDIVLEELERIVPEGTYYANWNADELFVIFYSDQEDTQRTMEMGIRFALALAQSVANEVYQRIDERLSYDIGLACGIGFLGLQGPRRMKKTTITGESAGQAKRLEQEAKSQRHNLFGMDASPILLMDATLFRFALERKLLSRDMTMRIESTTRNIEGLQVYLWHPDASKHRDDEKPREIRDAS